MIHIPYTHHTTLPCVKYITPKESVIITENGCSDTSACLPSTVGIDDLDIKTLVLYPNPTSGVVSIQGAELNSDIVITNSLGQVVFKTRSVELTTQIDLSAYLNGIYTMMISSDYSIVSKRIVLNN